MTTLLEQLTEQKMNRCIHFNGSQNETCSAGVNYEEAFDGKRPGIFHRMPCHKNSTFVKPEFGPVVSCVKSEFLNQEDAELKAIESEKCFQNSCTAMLTAKADAKRLNLGQGNGGRGEVTCPICQGTLRYSVASVNGHMHGACGTSGCVSWME